MAEEKIVQEEMALSDGTEAAAPDQPQEKKRTKLRRFVARLLSFATGDILMATEAKGIYKFFGVLASLYFAGVICVLISLQVDLNYSELQSEVTLLEERAIRTAESRAQQTSYSAIRQQVEARGLDLEAPKGIPTTVR